MARPPDLERRSELLAAVVSSCADYGIGHRSLRDIAERIGTSHRMLIHHFGSRDDLMVAVVGAVESHQRELAAALDGPPETAVRQLWDRVSDPALRPWERLFFECYARGANGEAPFDRLTSTAVESWLGVHEIDPALRRLTLAVVRGLLLDLTATDDVAGTTAALDHFAAIVARPSP